MKKKILYVISVLFLFSCHEYMPPGITAYSTAEKYLDSLHRPDTIGIKIGMAYISLKDYAMPVKRRVFQQDTELNKVSAISWDDFTRKISDIVAKGKNRSKGVIQVLNYKIHNTDHTIAFFIDSSQRKVLDTIQMK